jgi:hypothetical protein
MKNYFQILLYTILLLGGCKQTETSDTITSTSTIQDENDTLYYDNKRYIQIGNFKISIEDMDYEESIIHILLNETILDTLFVSLGYSGYELKDLNSDGNNDIIITFTANRSCNVIMLFYETHYLIVDDCDKCDFTNIEEITVNSEKYFTTYKNLGCASGIWETKLLKFNNKGAQVFYEAVVTDCEEQKIELKKFDTNGTLVFEKTLPDSLLKNTYNELPKVWTILSKTN